MTDDFIEEMFGRIGRALEARPDASPEDLMVDLTGDEGSRTVQEFNASGKTMLFLCLRVTTPDAIVVPGSITRACGRCGAAVWMSPATLATCERIVRREIVCLECSGLRGAGGDGS